MSTTSHRRQEDEADAPFGEDEVLIFMQRLAELGLVATVSANGGAAGDTDPLRWTFRVLGQGGVVTEGASVGECVRRAWTTLRNAGQPMDVRLPDWAGDAGGDGIGILVLDWLVDQGASVFLKADGERSTPGWTFIVQFGPLTQTLRADGPRVERCFGQVVSRLRAEGTNVPV